MFGHIPDRDTALVMLMSEAQLLTLENICDYSELNPTSMYREIDWTKSFVYIFCLISDTDTALVMHL